MYRKAGVWKTTGVRGGGSGRIHRSDGATPRTSQIDLRLLVTRRWLIVAAVMLGVGVLVPSPATAEFSGAVNISVNPEPNSEPTAGQLLSIMVSGTSSQAGELAVYMFEGSSPCPSVQHKEEVVLAGIASPTPVLAGSYSQTYSVTPGSAGTYMVCGYLYDPSTDAIYADGVVNFTATKPLPHLRMLTVKVREHPGHTAANPGHTELRVQVTEGAAARVVLKHRGHTETTEPAWNSASQGMVEVSWTCRQPGGVYHYTITATDSYGDRLIRHGTFSPVSAARCRALRAADARRHREEAAYRHREEAAGEREAKARERQSPVTEAKADQRALCESGLDGLGERGYVIEQSNDTETVHEVAMVCKVVGFHREPRYYRLNGDHPIEVRYEGTEEPGPIA
jgi:hypothetical protein